MKIPTRLQANAYRILRIPGGASNAEIHSAASTLKRNVTLGITQTGTADIPILGEVPRTDADIRSAIGRLESPSQRIVERLFWLRKPPVQDTQVESSKTSSTVAIRDAHDSALLGLISVSQTGFAENGLEQFVAALRAWSRVIADDQYWIEEMELEERGRFEPKPLVSEYEALRANAVLFAAEPLIAEAKYQLDRGETAASLRFVRALHQLSDTGSWSKDAVEQLLAPMAQKVAELAKTVRAECGAQIVREPASAERNRSICDAALKRFRKEIEPALNDLMSFGAPESSLLVQAREQSALCLSGIATDVTWADDFILAENLHKEAHALAKDTLGIVRIEHGLSEIKDSAAHQRFYGRPVKSAPGLSTLNGIGATLYGSSDYDPATQSYVTTHYFVVLFVPVFPLGRYRVINDGGGRYRFIGKLPLRTFDRWYIAVSLAVISGLILYSMFSDASPTRSNYVAPSSYSSPSTTDPQLSQLKSEIDSGRTRISQLEAELKPTSDELDTLQRQIETLKQQLASMDQLRAQSIEIDIDDYNNKVERHNALLRKYNQLFSEHQTEFDEYNELLKRDHLLVGQYNSLVRTNR